MSVKFLQVPTGVCGCVVSVPIAGPRAATRTRKGKTRGWQFGTLSRVWKGKLWQQYAVAFVAVGLFLCWANKVQVRYCRYRAAPYKPLYEARPVPVRTPATYHARHSGASGDGRPSHEQHGQPLSSQQPDLPLQDEVWVHVCTMGPVSER